MLFYIIKLCEHLFKPPRLSVIIICEKMFAQLIYHGVTILRYYNNINNIILLYNTICVRDLTFVTSPILVIINNNKISSSLSKSTDVYRLWAGR